MPLPGPALTLLAEIKAKAEPGAEYVFPGRLGGHREEIKKTWADACKRAGLVEVRRVRGRDETITAPRVRVHDLRHTYASVLAGAGMSLPLIGALLGHTQPATTARYAHLLDDPQRKAAERAAAIISGAPSAEISEIGGKAHG